MLAMTMRGGRPRAAIPERWRQIGEHLKLPALITPQWGLLVLCLVVFLKSPSWLRRLDATAAGLDPGILTVLAFGLLLVITASIWTYYSSSLLFKLCFGTGTPLSFHLKFLLPWQRALLYLGSYFFFFFGFLWCVTRCL